MKHKRRSYEDEGLEKRQKLPLNYHQTFTNDPVIPHVALFHKRSQQCAQICQDTEVNSQKLISHQILPYQIHITMMYFWLFSKIKLTWSKLLLKCIKKVPIRFWWKFKMALNFLSDSPKIKSTLYNLTIWQLLYVFRTNNRQTYIKHNWDLHQSSEFRSNVSRTITNPQVLHQFCFSNIKIQI